MYDHGTQADAWTKANAAGRAELEVAFAVYTLMGEFGDFIEFSDGSHVVADTEARHA